MSKKVLFVTNSSTTLLLEQTILQEYTGHEFVTATDGVEAIQRAVEERPDLVVMDVVMPRMNGFEACRRMRIEAGLKEVPIILVTTRGEEDCIEAGWKCGCTDFVTKPINCRELLALIHSHLAFGRSPVAELSNDFAIQ